jgi:hypothetical protein
MAINLSEEQRIALQKIADELQKRQTAGTASNETRSGVLPTTPVASTTQQELAQIKANITPTPAPTPPAGTTDASTLGASPIPDTSKTTPTTTTDTSNITSNVAGANKAIEDAQKKIDEENKAYQAKLEAEQKAGEDALKASMGTSATGYEGLVEKAEQRPTTSIEAKLKEEQDKAGITALQTKLSTQQAKITSIQNEIATDEATTTAEIENARNRLSSMESISADINEINYKANLVRAKKTALLGAEAAVAQVYQGDLTTAKNMVADIVNAYTADKQSEVDKFDNLFNVYSSWTDSLDKDEKAILEYAHDTAIDSLKTAKEDATNVMNLMLQYPSAGISLSDSVSTATTKASTYQNTHKDESAVLELQLNYPNAGILPTDSVQTATQKSVDYQIANPDIDTQVVGSAETGYSLINSKTGETIKQISSGAGVSTNEDELYSTLQGVEDYLVKNPDKSILEAMSSIPSSQRATVLNAYYLNKAFQEEQTTKPKTDALLEISSGDTSTTAIQNAIDNGATNDEIIGASPVGKEDEVIKSLGETSTQSREQALEGAGKTTKDIFLAPGKAITESNPFDILENISNAVSPFLRGLTK